MCVDPPPPPCYFDLRCSTVTSKNHRLDLHATIGRVCDQVNLTSFLAYRGTVWGVKGCVSDENGKFYGGEAYVYYNMCKQVIFLC